MIILLSVLILDIYKSITYFWYVRPSRKRSRNQKEVGKNNFHVKLFLQFVGETQDCRAQRVTLLIRTKILKKEIINATIKNIISLSKVIY